MALGTEIAWLYGLQHFGIKLGLEPIRGLLGALDHPERALRSVLVAGTNGKGSVAAMLQAMLLEAGPGAGLYTSPHLVRPNERIRIGERDLDDEELGRQLSRTREAIEAALARGVLEAPPSFFEVVTATALHTFADHGVELAVLEVGLGGRLDATNAVEAELAVIVNVDLDHMQILGDTVGAIAAEKGGIIKVGRPVVSGAVRQGAIDVLRRMAHEREAPFIDALAAVRFLGERDGAITLQTEARHYPELRLPLAGRHQIHNLRVALAAFELLGECLGFRVSADLVRSGLSRVRWPGRLQWIHGEPDLLLDGAHNPAGAAALAGYLRGLPAAPVALFGLMRDKPLEELLAPLAPHLHAIVLTRPSVERALDPSVAAEDVRRHVARVEVVPEPEAALERARQLAGAERCVLVTGSLYLVGDVLRLLDPRSAPGPVSL